MATTRSLINTIAKSIPGFEKEFKKATPLPNIYKIFQLFADFTKSLALRGDSKAVKKSLTSACELWHGGDVRIKNAVENIYLYMLYPFTQQDHEFNGYMETILKEKAELLYCRLKVDDLP